MSDFTPMTEEVRELVVFALTGGENWKTPAAHCLECWLARHDAEVAAKALRDHAKRVAYWHRDRSPRVVTYSAGMIVADLEEYAHRIEREAGVR